MAHCGGGEKCNCLIKAGSDNVHITGTGSLSSPFTIAVDPVGGVPGGGGEIGGSTLTVVAVTTDFAYTPPGPGADSGIMNVVFVQDSVGGHTVTRGTTVLLAAGASWEFSTEPGAESVAVFRPRADLSAWVCEGCWISVTTAMANADVTPPAPGALSSYAVSDTNFGLSVTGASDAIGLHALPYDFSTDNGTTWAGWQAGSTYTKTGATPSTAYTCKHRVRDAAGNSATGSAIVVTTTANPTDTTNPVWSATFTMGTPTETTVTATASAMATDNVAVTGYEVSYNNGTSWDPITPSGSVFTLAGSQGTTYNTTKLRARDAAGNRSSSLSVPTYTMASSVPPVGTPATLAEAVTLWGGVGYWKLDETSGTTMTDSSGNGRHGTLSGTAGNDYVLAGTGGRLNLLTDLGKVTVPDSDALSIPSGGLSVFATVYQPGGGGSSRNLIVKNGGSGGEWEAKISFLKPRAASTLDSGSPASSSNCNNDMTATTWHGIAFAIPRPADGVPVIWVDNGTPQDVTSTAYTTGTITPNTTQPVVFGGAWIGAMGHVIIFPFKLTNAHAQKLMDLARSAGLIP